jgi:hypothetical protein
MVMSNPKHLALERAVCAELGSYPISSIRAAAQLLPIARRSYARSRFFADLLAMTCGQGGRISTSEPDHHRLRLELHAPYLLHPNLDLIFQGQHLSSRGSASIDDCESVFV